MPRLPKKCPSCSSDLVVTRLGCPACGTEVSGSYPPDLFSHLAPNDFDFVVLFVRTKGNIKEMERALGISYWTIRGKLNEIVQQLGLESDAGHPAAGDLASRRQEILEQLNAGMLSAQEAAALLNDIKPKP